MCGKFGITLVVVIFGRSIELMCSESADELVGIDAVGLLVSVGVLVVVVVLVGVLVGIVGISVGVVGILVGIVGIGFMTGEGFIIEGIVPIDRRARVSSGSTEIEKFRFDRR